jgi:saccharopine dehydrogenase-like NADP-dependent oxidoreductase
VVAGQSTAQYLENGKLKFRPYNRIFINPDNVKIKGLGQFDAYPNRDSLSYITPYGIEKAKTVIRGTLRYSGYCNAWHCLTQLGLTDDTFTIHNSDKLSFKEFTHSFLPLGCKSLKDFVKKECGLKKSDEAIKMINWLGLESNSKIKLKEATPAQILQQLLEGKWLLKSKDLDMIVMKHEFEYTIKGKKKKVDSTLVLEGENQTYTAMAKTVGLPLAIAAKLVLTGKIKNTGVIIPLEKNIYEPVLAELETLGVKFIEKYY